MGDVAESDWKLFRERLPRWQESYMEKLIDEYMEMLSGEDLASEKFWALEKRVNEDKRRSGVLIERMSRSTMHREIALWRGTALSLPEILKASPKTSGVSPKAISNEKG